MILVWQPALTAQPAEIKIGMLIPDRNSVAARDGALLALSEINSAGGNHGIPFRLVVKSMEGPWGTGSKQAVDLAYIDEVVAVIGSVDGRNAHLIEQVSGKERFPFISAWSPDPTLGQAFIPWFFNCVPVNDRQSEALINEIWIKEGIKNPVIVSDNSYDSRMAFKSLNIQLSLKTIKEPVVITFDTGSSGNIVQKTIKSVSDLKPDGVLIFGQGRNAIEIVKQLHAKDPGMPLFSNLMLLGETKPAAFSLSGLESVISVSPAYYFSEKGKTFIADFKKKYGYFPGPVAAYAYDAMYVMTAAMINTGTEREKIQDWILKNRHEGITGSFSFDARGNRKELPDLFVIKNGQPRLLKTNKVQ